MRYVLALMLLMAVGCTRTPTQSMYDQPQAESISRIAFGSCYRADGPKDVWTALADAEPDLFIMLGDNVYADTEDEAEMQAAYDELAADPGFAAIRDTTPILATWDDHDYGKNDAGSEYPAKAMAQQLFLDFFEEPPLSDRRFTHGIYDAEILGPTGQRVQIILLDTRYFRSGLISFPALRRPNYQPNRNPEATMLGDAQWEWLEQQLKKPADLRIIATSIQFIPKEHRFEKWWNFPLERQRLIDMIADTNAQGVVFISGDRHLAELSVLKPGQDGAPYPLYDVTSSSLTAGRDADQKINESNRYRVDEPFGPENFGLLDIDWSEPDPTIRMEIRDAFGKPVITQDTTLGTLRRAMGTGQ